MCGRCVCGCCVWVGGVYVWVVCVGVVCGWVVCVWVGVCVGGWCVWVGWCGWVGVCVWVVWVVCGWVGTGVRLRGRAVLSAQDVRSVQSTVLCRSVLCVFCAWGAAVCPCAAEGARLPTLRVTTAVASPRTLFPNPC